MCIFDVIDICFKVFASMISYWVFDMLSASISVSFNAPASEFQPMLIFDFDIILFLTALFQPSSMSVSADVDFAAMCRFDDVDI